MDGHTKPRGESTPEEYNKGSHSVYDIEYHCATVGSVTEETIRKYIENQEVSGSNEIFKIDE